MYTQVVVIDQGAVDDVGEGGDRDQDQNQTLIRVRALKTTMDISRGG